MDVCRKYGRCVVRARLRRSRALGVTEELVDDLAVERRRAVLDAGDGWIVGSTQGFGRAVGGVDGDVVVSGREFVGHDGVEAVAR